MPFHREGSQQETAPLPKGAKKPRGASAPRGNKTLLTTNRTFTLDGNANVSPCHWRPCRLQHRLSFMVVQLSRRSAGGQHSPGHHPVLPVNSSLTSSGFTSFSSAFVTGVSIPSILFGFNIHTSQKTTAVFRFPFSIERQNTHCMYLAVSAFIILAHTATDLLL